MSTKVHPQFAEFRLRELAYQPTTEAEFKNPLEDMEMFQTQDVIDRVVTYVSKFAYNDECEVLYKKFDERMSIATIEQDKNEFIFVIFDKQDYWIEIRRKFVNQNNRKVTRRRKVNWIACHSCICDQHVQVNVEKLFR